ncbi:histone-lysine N-methyltransferase SETMAR [Plakobranchus ocellatus]|uniref:Histone-lysine N-methyltransferase SETMAR n=1 Tax=Plakobranchus ocellatus TaxID=259542 RepID=A0AAV3YL59_9GAST|nr:histone-lysine N-methyltransferase SETMAR [Plakobranchus ocellatus]
MGGPAMLLVICLFGQLHLSVTGQGISEYSALTTSLFQGYEKRVRPSVAGSPTTVYMIFEPSSILSLDENEQVLYTYATFKCSWFDDHLAWNTSDYNNITSFLWPQDDVWLPDLIITNSVKNPARLGYDEMPVRVRYTGSVTWYPSKIFATSCDMDVTYYPFDTQICTLILSTKMSTYQEIEIAAGGSPISWAEYSPGSTWDLKTIAVEALDNQGDITRIQFKLTLKRLRTYYVMNIILPVLFLSFTASIVFYLPADAGEKIGMSMTVLLAYAVYLTIIADNMPQTSLQVSLLAVYLTMLLGFTALGVILSVIVLSLHFTGDDIPVGHRTAFITRKIRRFLRLRRYPKRSVNRVSPHMNRQSPSLKHRDIALDGQGFGPHVPSSPEQKLITQQQDKVSATSASGLLRPRTSSHCEKPRYPQDGDAVSSAPSIVYSENDREIIT